MKQSSDGNYYWTGIFDKDYEKEQYRIVWITVGIICVFLIVFGGFLILPSGDWQLFMPVLLPCLAVIGITYAIIAIFKTGPGSKRDYGMNENGIWMGSRRSRVDFYFRSAKHVIFTKNYIEPVKKTGGFRIYVPKEDMLFIKDYVRRHLPDNCEVEERPL